MTPKPYAGLLLLLFLTFGFHANGQEQLTSYRLLPQYVNDMVYDTLHGNIIMSIPSSDVVHGNSIGFLHPDSSKLSATYFLGSEPNPIELTYNSRYLYVGMDGSQSLKRFDVGSKAVTQTISGFGSQGGRPRIIRSIHCPPAADSVTVLTFMFASTVPAWAGTAAYVNGVRLKDTLGGFGDLVSTAHFYNSDTLYGCNNESTSFEFYTLRYDSTGLHKVNKVPGLVYGSYEPDFHYKGTKAITDNGRVIELGTTPPSAFGSFMLTKTWSNFYQRACYDKALDLWCFAGWGFDNDSIYLERFHAGNFLRKDFVRICKSEGNVKDILYLGDSSKYAISTQDSVLIIVDGYQTATPNPTSAPYSAKLAKALNFYPNPTSDIINIDYPEPVHVQIFNEVGALMLDKKATKSISLKGLPSARYNVRCYDARGSLIGGENVIRE